MYLYMLSVYIRELTPRRGGEKWWICSVVHVVLFTDPEGDSCFSIY